MAATALFLVPIGDTGRASVQATHRMPMPGDLAASSPPDRRRSIDAEGQALSAESRVGCPA